MYPGILLTLLLALLMCAPLPAQERPGDAGPPAADPTGVTGAGAEDTADTAGDDGAVAEDAEDEAPDDADLDEQVYEEDEDDFIPSEEIPADEAIPFPTNI